MVGAELALEIAQLPDPDPVLAGDRAVELDRPGEDLVEGGMRPVHRALVRRVEDRGRMQVAVARVTERADLELVALGDLLDLLDHLTGRLGGLGDPHLRRALRLTGLRHPLQVALDHGGVPVLPEDEQRTS